MPGIEALVGSSGYAIIVSVQGPRSAADMMAGGDLDGDSFWVCFNEEVGLDLFWIVSLLSIRDYKLPSSVMSGLVNTSGRRTEYENFVLLGWQCIR